MLPSTEDGYLPIFLLTLGSFAIIHTVVCYTAPAKTSMGQFEGPRSPPPSLLLAHVYGVKNFYTSLMRIYAAYYINNRELYTLAIASFAGVMFLNVGEFLIWRTSSFRSAFFPILNSGIGLVWMLSQREWYGRL
ncbi:hypothetical protein OQA88_13312 [Cercophora sp. LCS_1]